MAPTEHNIDLRVAEQHYNKSAARSEVKADKYLMVMMPKTTNPGTVGPASTADTSGEYAVYRYAAYKDGETLWDIDPRNFKCDIFGVDYLANVRKALGK